MKISSMYRPEIDGLRAVAVLAVILFHAGVPGFGGGYVGVDVFFVISGYLITSLIVAEREAGTFSLLRFYERRARRILPALLAVLLVTAVVVKMVHLPVHAKDAYQSMAAAMGMVSNLLFWKESGYFAAAAELKPLLHTWSLAVEEQFYLLYPLVVLGLLRMGRRWFAPLLGVVAVASLAAAQWVAGTDPDAAFFLLPMRVWELLVGCLLAWFLPNHRREWQAAAWHVWGRQLGAVAGLGLIAAATVLYDETVGTAVYLAAPVLGAALVIAFATPETIVGRLLGSRPAVGVGLISYSAYLIHQPLFALVRYGQVLEPSLWVMLLLSAATFAAAWLSWRFVEQPFRRAETIGRLPLVWMGCAGVMVFGAIGVAGHFTRGFEDVYRATLTEHGRTAYDRFVAMNEVQGKIEDTGGCRFNMDRLRKIDVQRFEQCAARHGKATIVLGDSHALMVYASMLANTDHPFLVGVIRGACQLSRSRFYVCPFDKFKAFADSHVDQIERILYVQSGTWLLEYPVNPAPTERMIAYLNELPAGIDVVMFGPQVEPFVRIAPLVPFMTQCKLGAFTLDAAQVQKYENLDHSLQERFAAQSQIRYLSLIDALQFDPATDLYDCDAVFWFDQNHWNQAGELRFGKRLLAAHPELAEQK